MFVFVHAKKYHFLESLKLEKYVEITNIGDVTI